MLCKKSVTDAWKLIERSKKITLLTHSRPDGDGVYCCSAFDLILSRMGKSVETVYPNMPELEFKRSPSNVLIAEHTTGPDLLIFFDSANYERVYYPDQFKSINSINIDHHVSNSIDSTFNFVIPESSSASEVLYYFIDLWDKSLIDKDVAQRILSGIMCDTGIFSSQSTSSSTLRIAAELIDSGVDLFELKVDLLSNKNPDIIKLWKFVLDRIELSGSKKTVWTYITQKDLKDLNLTLTSLVGFINFLAEISGVDVTLLFYETEDNKTKVSMRSKEYDVNKFAAQFGGGGHKNAAGIMSDKKLDVFMKEVTSKVK